MSSRRRILMRTEPTFESDAEIPADWKAKETIKDSWAKIIYYCQKGTYKNRYRIGDTKVADFGSEGLCLMHIVGFDTDELEDGNGFCRIAWLSEHRLKTDVNYDTRGTGDVYYGQATISSKLQDCFALLPPILQANIVKVKKYCCQYSTNKQKSTVTVMQKLWIPSYREIYGETTFEDRGPVYSDVEKMKTPYFAGNTPYEGGRKWVWLRSKDSYPSTIRIMGETNSHTAYNCGGRGGILPGFCI